MTEREIICVMVSVGLILTMTFTGSIILHKRMEHRAIQDRLNMDTYPIYSVIPLKGSVE